MVKLNLKCSKCKKVMETLPRACAEDMIIDEETGQMLYNMGPKYGYRSIDEIICKECQEKDC